ncbi:PadR family transcriptional regulator [Rhodococcus rhodochrous]|uniref:PadR family transcriptional regulator n=1 Tax=Rhodococcus rhodochrous TaxID=1829 RepID=UPI001E3E0463|nr:PadR family transcriptional regulator [Rhodococcus rhodochrous]MCD2100524.1 PadR family transcriptional regulator [Rhodococcus rhodochrous]MCD2124848.1 PadR family transcriptional regulator [Rhodococcus rhodochrous]MCQ4138240.1 PadR family transcriptional regulator [Rhodococcus rhodochrous]MDJ0021679.1 PadR family transcriptional regulator [Rhodococcus rhodochrous]
MSLRYALLALLTAGPSTGYDAAKRFGGSVGNVWHAPDSQIYPELRKMEADGLVSGQQVRWGPRSTKRLYTITDEGNSFFREWVNSTVDHTPVRDAHHMQAAYFEWAEPNIARAILLRHIAHHAEQVELFEVARDGIQTKTDPAIVRRLAGYPETDHARIIAYKVHSCEGMIARSRSEIDWAIKGLRLIDLYRVRDADLPGGQRP